MKQTKNALSMLLNAYRAIFKSAYFKGMASAVVLTAGLAAGAANADTLSGGTSQDGWTGLETITITGAGSASSGLGEYQYIQVGQTGGKLELGDKDLLIQSGSATNNFVSGSSADDAQLIGTGTLTIDKGENSEAVLHVGASGSVSMGAIDVINGNLLISGDANPNATAATIKVGALNPAENASGTITIGTSGSLGRYAADATTNSEITVNKSGTIYLQGTADDGIAKIDGASLEVTAGGQVIASGSASSYGNIAVQELTIDGDDAFVGTSGDGTNTGNLTISATTFTLNEGTLSASVSGDTLTITSHDGTINGEKANLSSVSGATVQIELKDDETGNHGQLNVESGNVEVSGQLQIKQGTVSIDPSVKLYSTNSSAAVGSSPASAIILDGQNKTTANVATLEISQAKLTEFLNATTTGLAEGVTAQKGVLQVTSGAVVDFGDKVTLSDFAFSGGTATTGVGGKIVLAAAGSSGSIFRANEVTVAHKLEQDLTSHNVENAASGAVIIEAATLNLGSSETSGSDTDEILFKEARVSDTINFITGDGKDYVLMSDVKAQNFTTVEKGEDTYYYAQPGTITGNVTISGDATNTGSLAIEQGNWTAKGNVTVQSGGSITVQNTAYSDGNHSDASLAFEEGLTLDVSKANTDVVEVKVVGNTTAGQRFVLDEDKEGNQGKAVLDLTGGVKMLVNSTASSTGQAKITASSGGIIVINDTDLETLMSKNEVENLNAASGALVQAASGAVIDVKGDLDVGFGAFTSTSTNHGIYLEASGAGTQGGFLFADSLNVTHEDEGSTGANTEQSLKLNGTVVVDNLSVNDKQYSGSAYRETVTIANGKAIIAEGLSSVNDTLNIGDARSSEAHLVFAAPSYSGDGTIDVNKLNVASGSVLVANGQWDAAETDIVLANKSTLTVGGDFYFEGLFEDGEDMYGFDQQASLTAADLTMAATNTVTIGSNGTLKLQTAKLLGTVNVAGNLYIAGDADAVEEGVRDETNGVSLDGTITIENNGVMELGAAAVDGAVIASGVAYTTAEQVEAALGENSSNFNQITNNGGQLKLDFGSDTSFSAEAMQALKEGVYTSGSFATGEDYLKNGGSIHIGDAQFDSDIDPVTGESVFEEVELDNGLTVYRATWDAVKGFSDVYGTDVTNNQHDNSNIYEVSYNDQVSGMWGSLTMENATTSESVKIAGDTTLSFAAGNNNFFISDASRESAKGADVAAQKILTLANGGQIGAVTLAAAEGTTSSSERDYTVLRVQGDSTVPTVIDSVKGTGATAGSYAQNTVFDVNADTVVTNDVDGIESVEVSSASLTAKNVTDVDEVYVDALGSLDVTEQLSAHVIETEGGDITTADLSLLIKNTNEYGYISAVNGATLTVTGDLDANGGRIEVGTDELDAEQTAAAMTRTGYLEVENLMLDGGYLVVDPSYEEKTSVAAVNHFATRAKQTFTFDQDAGTIQGHVLVGQNAALGINATLAETQAAIAKYQNANGALNAEKYGSILYLDGHVVLGSSSDIALNSAAETSRSISDSLYYLNEAGGYTVTGNYYENR